MTVLELTKQLNSYNSRSEVLKCLHDFINNPITSFSEEQIVKCIKSISHEDFSAFGNKLGYCRIYCIDEINKDPDGDEDYLYKLKTTKEVLDKLSSIYQHIAEEVREKEKESNEAVAMAQNALVLKELNKKYSEMTLLIDEAHKKIDGSSNKVDEKMFTLLINTVAILGIFVAIAFTGLGISEIFPTIDFSDSFSNPAFFIKNLFLLLFVTLICYNLLLLLVYMIFKLSRPIFLMVKQKEDKEDKKGNNKIEAPDSFRFNKTVGIVPFLVIDGVLFVCTVVSFWYSMLMW